ncbi:unnamed protein product, partial [Urochloa humidicola]
GLERSAVVSCAGTNAVGGGIVAVRAVHAGPPVAASPIFPLPFSLLLFVFCWWSDLLAKSMDLNSSAGGLQSSISMVLFSL